MEIPLIKTLTEFRAATSAQRDQWKNLFVEMNDPTGYAFSQVYCDGGYPIWKLLMGGYKTKEELQTWIEELEVKLQAKGIQALASADSTDAAKWLATRGWAPKEDKRTKEGRKKAERMEAAVEADLERLGVSLINKHKNAKTSTAA